MSKSEYQEKWIFCAYVVNECPDLPAHVCAHSSGATVQLLDITQCVDKNQKPYTGLRAQLIARPPSDREVVGSIPSQVILKTF